LGKLSFRGDLENIFKPIEQPQAEVVAQAELSMDLKAKNGVELVDLWQSHTAVEVGPTMNRKAARKNFSTDM
jgi:hypothetical protein